MNTTLTTVAGIPVNTLNVETCIVLYVRNHGPIESLDRWAHSLGYTPWWVNHCAYSAAKKRLVKLTRLINTSGRPYRVSALEEETHDNN